MQQDEFEDTELGELLWLLRELLSEGTSESESESVSEASESESSSSSSESTYVPVRQPPLLALAREEDELKRWSARAPAIAARQRARGSKFSRSPERSCSFDGVCEVSHWGRACVSQWSLWRSRRYARGG